MHGEQGAERYSPEEAGPLAETTIRVYHGARLVGTHRPSREGLLIGKAPGNDIVLASAQISRVHARIHGAEGAWVLEDQASTNGTFVYAGERLIYSSLVHPGPWLLGDQQEIRFGPGAGEWRLVFSDPTTTDKSPPVSIDEARRQVWVRGCQVRLPRDHYTVLLALYQRAPFPCAYEDLCAALNQDRQARRRPTYSELASAELESLHHLIHRLRARIEVDPRHPALILQQPHFGYRLFNQADPDEPARPAPLPEGPTDDSRPA